MPRTRFCLVFLVLAGLVLSACSGNWGNEQAISSTPSPYSKPTSSLVAVGPTHAIGKSTPTSTRQSAMPTATSAPGRFRIVKISEQGQGIAGAWWSEDGRSVVFATWGESYEIIEAWWRYTISTGKRQPIESPLDLNPEIWTQLEASDVDDVFVWFGGGLSPSGARVVYNRLPAGYTYTPAPDEVYLTPYEAWTARSDGSDAVKLQCYCRHIVQAIWLDQERKVILICGDEGGNGVLVADVDGNSCVPPLDGLGVSHRVALSPDETKLAFPGLIGMLQIVSLDGSEIQPVARWGYMPNWSPDGRRLYYLHVVEEFDLLADVRVYDLDTGVNSLLIPSPLHTSKDTVSIPIGTFVVSPLENAAVFKCGGLCLVTWAP